MPAYMPNEIRTVSIVLSVRASAAAVAILVGACMSGCAPGKRPFLIAQMCLPTEQEVTIFTQQLQQIAMSEGAKFVDDSRNTEKYLRDVGNANVDKMIGRHIINMGIERGHGIGLMAGNLSLGHGVAIGFSEGSDPSEAHKFSDRVLNQLGQHWHVEFVPNPADSGASPMANCK